MAARGLLPSPARFLMLYLAPWLNLSMTSQQRTEREASLTHSVQKSLPGFIDACNADIDEVVLDQSAFAVNYEDDEYKLLGMAIKYAGLR